MDLFRRKQKLIFWIVTIIIVPSFVLVWGVSDIGRPGDDMNFEVATVESHSLRYPEFESFQRRIRAALGNIPFQFSGAPAVGTPHEDLYKYVLTYTLLRDAEKSGIIASDLQVGTYIENAHPVIAASIVPGDPQSKEKAVDTFCRQMKITRQDFLRGVREWQTISNYLDADANITAVNDETVFAIYALNLSECVVKRIRFPETDAIRESVKEELLAMPAEELQDEIRVFLMGNAEDSRYREPSRWRFDWIFVPSVAEESVRQPSESDIEERYRANASTIYDNQPLEEVREAIIRELNREEVDRQTLRNFTVDVDPQIRAQGADMEAAELVKLAQLVKYGATAGDTGEEALPPPAIAQRLPEGTEFQISQLLDGIDAESMEVRQAMIDEWKSGFTLVERPFKAEKGLYRLRLLEYLPSTPADFETEDGQIKPEYYELALADLVAARTAEAVRDQAAEFEDRLRAYLNAKESGEPVPDEELASQYEAMPEETIRYLEMSDATYELGRLPVGELLGPDPYRGEESTDAGQEIVVMVERRAPSREDFAAEPEEVKARYRQMATANFQGNTGFTYTFYGPTAIIQPSATIMAGLVDRLYKNRILINPDLLRTGAEG